MLRLHNLEGNSLVTRARKAIAISLITALFGSPSAFAYEVLDVCATYLNTGKSYKVQGQKYKGTELNQRTNSYNYNYYSTYFVIFWSQDQASVIELDSIYGSISHLGTWGTDQRGYEWKLSKGHAYCW